MSKLVIVTHPSLKDSLINRIWLAELANHSEAFEIHSLYEKYPDLNFDVAAEQELLSKYDEIVFQFPLHWFNVPFALKKYIDEVLAYGWAFGPGGDKMKGKKIRFAVSTGGTKDTYESRVTLDDLLKPMSVTFHYCGCEVLPSHVFYGASNQPSEDAVVSNAKEYASSILG